VFGQEIKTPAFVGWGFDITNQAPSGDIEILAVAESRAMELIFDGSGSIFRR